MMGKSTFVEAGRLFKEINMKCPTCNKETEHLHKHNEAHGISGTHMSGSERYECVECGYSMGKVESEKQGLKFVLD